MISIDRMDARLYMRVYTHITLRVTRQPHKIANYFMLEHSRF